MSNYNKTVLGKNNKIKPKAGKFKYLVGYTKRVGGTNIVTIIAENAEKALKNAKNAIKTGSKFYILKRL
jgi:hypothetical protein